MAASGVFSMLVVSLEHRCLCEINKFRPAVRGKHRLVSNCSASGERKCWGGGRGRRGNEEGAGEGWYNIS